MVADDRARVNVDAGVGVRVLGEHARDDRDPQQVQLMGGAVIEHRRHRGIAIDDFLGGLDGRVVVGDGFDVSAQELPDAGEFLHERRCRRLVRHRLELGLNTSEGVVFRGIAILGENGVLDALHQLLEVTDGPFEGKVHVYLS